MVQGALTHLSLLDAQVEFAALEALRAELDAAPRDAELTLTWRLSRPR